MMRLLVGQLSTFGALRLQRWCLTPSSQPQGGTTSEEDDEGYVTDPEPDAGAGASLGLEPATDSSEGAAQGEEEETVTPDSVEEFRQRLARQESGAEAGTSSRPAAAFGLEACFRAVWMSTTYCRHASTLLSRRSAGLSRVCYHAAHASAPASASEHNASDYSSCQRLPGVFLPKNRWRCTVNNAHKVWLMRSLPSWVGRTPSAPPTEWLSWATAAS
jgi:hypothetical protein